MSNIKELHSLANKFSLLYVEDNEKLRDKAVVFLKKFFRDVVIASDGQQALEIFKKHSYPVLITDIKMPNMNGMELSKHVKTINPQTEIVIMSAFDDKELLMKGIEFGVFRFLKKPVDAKELIDVLYEVVSKIIKEQHKKLFYMHLKSVFNYQSSMVCMLQDSKIVIANEIFLEFFGCDSVTTCEKEISDVGSYFLPHDGFLYNQDKVDALKTLKENPDKLFHVKLKTTDGNIHHCIVNYHIIPDKDGYGVLSFDDITELNLLKLFDLKQTNEDEDIKNQDKLFDLLSVIQKHTAKIELHNYYKGLSITNNGVIVDIKKEKVTIKTTYMQQKAIQLEQKVFIVSTALPFVVEATRVESISFEKQTVEFSNLRFVQTSPIMRKTIRLSVENNYSVSLFLGESKFHGDITIADLSLDAIRVHLNALPAGLQKDSIVRLDIVLDLDKRPIIINTEAVLYKKHESSHNFSLVFVFKDLKKSSLVKYITKRQMELIREMKGMQNG